MRFLDRLAVMALIALLTWLLFMGFSHADQRVQHSLAGLGAFMTSQGALHRDVLSARAGLLNNYDPLDVDMAGMSVAVNDALVSASSKSEREQGRNLLLVLRRQKALANQFKSTNALVQNSLAYFATYSGQVSANTLHPQIQGGVDRLSSAMLNLNLNGSSLAQEDVSTGIAVLEQYCARMRCEAEVQSLIAHARLLKDQLPIISITIEQLVRSDSDAPVAALRNLFLERQMEREDFAARFRILLYLASLLLLYLLVRWGLAVRTQAAVLQRQVALEHGVAHLSTRLIGTAPDEFGLCVRDALEQLAAVLGAGCILFVGRSDQVFGWPVTADLEKDQIEALKTYSMPRTGAEDSVARISRHGAAPDSIRRLFGQLTVESIFCLASPKAEGGSNLLFLGFQRANAGWPARQLAVLRTALDAISLSLDHASLENERRKLESQLEHARRMETVGAFASGIAHNFNNLLGAVSGQLEMAEDMRDLSPALRDHLDQMRISTDRGHQLVQALMSYGRRHDRHREMTHLGDLVLESRNLARAALGSSYRIDLDAGSGDAAVMIDGVQLQQVILNLCHNAAQAMAGGGVVRIRTGIKHVDEGQDESGKRLNSGDYAFVSISDEGVGIDAELRGKIFEPFFTTRPSGTGLGLSTARDIVREHDGSLSLESEVGRGTCVTIALPIPSADMILPDVAESVRQGTGEAILYISTSLEKCIAGEDLLAALGYEPTGVASLEQAVALLTADPGRFDAVIVGGYALNVDINAFFDAVRALAPQTLRILAIDRPQMENPNILAAAHISAVLQFPLNARELANILESSMK